MVREGMKLLSAAIFALAISIALPAAVYAPARFSQAPEQFFSYSPASPESSHLPILLEGKATHYDAERNGQSAWYTRDGIKFYAAAGPALREIIKHQWRGSYRVIVTSHKTKRSVVVNVVDYCECLGGDQDARNDRLIDLAPAVWNALDVPLGIGVMRVSIEILP
jgi:hypothetical protein